MIVPVVQLIGTCEVTMWFKFYYSVISSLILIILIIISKCDDNKTDEIIIKISNGFGEFDGIDGGTFYEENDDNMDDLVNIIESYNLTDLNLFEKNYHDFPTDGTRVKRDTVHFEQIAGFTYYNVGVLMASHLGMKST